jgi:hypothetical protein
MGKRVQSAQLRALDLAKEINQLEGQIAPLKERLAECKAEFFKLVVTDADPDRSGPESSSDNGPDAEREPFSEPDPESDSDGGKTVYSGTIADRIEQFVSSRPAGDEFDATTIAKAIGAELPTVRGVLRRMETAGRIRNPSRGIYVAKEESAS